MSWADSLWLVALAIAAFIVFELKDVLKYFANSKVKVAEARVREAELQLELAKLEIDRVNLRKHPTQP